MSPGKDAGLVPVDNIRDPVFDAERRPLAPRLAVCIMKSSSTSRKEVI